LGDRGAFEVLVARWLPRIRGFLFRIGGARGNPDDLAQQTFVVAIERLGDLRDAARVGSWIFGIAIRVQRAAQRRERSQRNAAADAEPEIVWEPRDEVSAEEDLRAVTRALDRLPERLREAFVLRHVEELAAAEVAAILGVPEGTARRWDFEARERLREMLASRFSWEEEAP
jgi:RNA polymerase sigma-70 factor (ECF subfamily)